MATRIRCCSPHRCRYDGRFVAYASYSRNIVADDTNNYCLNFFPDEQTSNNCVDVFLWDYDDTNHPQRVSRGAHGEEGNQGSLTPTMSRDATHVAFQSFATNLVAGDTNGTMDVFVRSFTDPAHFLSVPYGWSLNFRPRLRQSTTRISVSSSGDQANGSSFDRTLAMSANGRYVAFASSASNLVPGDTNAACDNDLDGVADENCYDVFVHDQVTGFTKRVSTATDGAEGNGRSSSPRCRPTARPWRSRAAPRIWCRATPTPRVRRAPRGARTRTARMSSWCNLIRPPHRSRT